MNAFYFRDDPCESMTETESQAVSVNTCIRFLFFYRNDQQKGPEQEHDKSIKKLLIPVPSSYFSQKWPAERVKAIA